MGKKGKKKGEAKEKKGVTPIIADPELEKTVLHALSVTPTSEITKKIIDAKKGGAMIFEKVGEQDDVTEPKDYRDLLNVCAEYVRIEQGDTNYQIAHEWVEKHWPDPLKVAGGIRILEETWNRAFYNQQRGIFSMARLGQAIKQHTNVLDELRLRHIETLDSADHGTTQMLWEVFFEALKPQKKPDSPYVATAKALHLLAPTFFVPFDSKIAENYGCNGPQPKGYIKFQHYMAESASHILDSFVTENGGNRDEARVAICECLYIQKTGSQYVKTLPKLLDEYNWTTRF